MINTLQNRLKQKRLELSMNEITQLNKTNNNKSIFSKIETDKNNRKLYYTKMFDSFYDFRAINQENSNKFFISLRGLFDQNKKETFYLFPLKADDKFLGMFYGLQKRKKPLKFSYVDEITKEHKISNIFKSYYVEFRFKKGSVFCLVNGMNLLVKKEKLKTKYCQTLIKVLLSLEKQVYEFYNKKLSEGGLISKWIEKKQK
ncbi:DUF226 domain-containing protein [Candidatus Borreliella tachyglossi]|uniref:DUF226 domain-containing protein n=1 Tax=Candidatus Borreliella tachyglossi TaxID=1964448 RepID=UPI00404234BE